MEKTCLITPKMRAVSKRMLFIAVEKKRDARAMLLLELQE